MKAFFLILSIGVQMETPSSTRRVTRSQASALANSNNKNIPVSRKNEESEKGISKSRQRHGHQDRSALIDITNDSPIVGLAMGRLETPLSSVTKQRNTQSKQMMTPGSGEALLRGQVKTLLQKVEEEADLSKLSLSSRPFLYLKGSVLNSPSLLAPTPMNTPHDINLSQNDHIANKDCLLTQDEMKTSKVVSDIFDGISPQSEKSVITRSLLLDFSEKSSATDDDDSSVWSIQVNASSIRDEEEEYEEGIEEEEEVDEEDADEDEYYCENEEEEGLVDELCEGMRNINVNEGKRMAEFKGKHVRFVYNSDDEIIEVKDENESGMSPSVLRLKGLPTPKGKHLRFHEEEKDS